MSADERTDLPDQVEAGTDYHDVRVDYRLATGLRRQRDDVQGDG